MNYKHWAFDAVDETYSPIFSIENKLPNDLFNVSLDQYDRPVVSKINLKDDKLFKFTTGDAVNLIKEIDQFWKSKEKFQSLGVTHKRSILLHGPPGCGKTSIISIIMKSVLDKEGIAINCNDVYALSQLVEAIKEIENDRNICIVIEDIDKFANNRYLLEVLDGQSSLGDGLLYLFTTNYLDKIPTTIKARPSRVDKLIEVSYPSCELRYQYLKQLCVNSFLKDDLFIRKVSDKTKGLSFASLKELIISISILDADLDLTIERLKELEKLSDDSDEDWE